MAEHDYEEGLRDGRIASLEATVKELANDVAKLKSATWLLYGAIAMVQFLPDIRDFLANGQ